MTRREWIGTAVSAVGIAIVIVGGIAVRIARIDATETRILVDYWWMWVSGFGLMSIGVLVMGNRR